jgi:hypothetical protein
VRGIAQTRLHVALPDRDEAGLRILDAGGGRGQDVRQVLEALDGE